MLAYKSSRNRYLQPEERAQATVLWRSQQWVRQEVRRSASAVAADTLRRGVEALIAQGVDTCFGVPGESYLAVLDALYDVHEIRFVICRQEGGVAMMAAAHGELTGRPGVAFVTRGPGATNASAGSAEG